MFCPACGRPYAGECDKMVLLKNELDYQKQAGSKTGAAALEFALAEIERLRMVIRDRDGEIDYLKSED